MDVVLPEVAPPLGKQGREHVNSLASS